MKSLSLLAGLLFCCCTAIYAQSGNPGKVHVGVNQQYHGKDTMRTFSVFGPDQEILLQKIRKAFGTPTSDKTGFITWSGISLKNSATKFNVYLSDGILFMNGDAFFGPFMNEEDKRTKLAGLKKGEKRVIEVEFKDAAGANAIDSKMKEDMVKDFLLSIIQKS